MLPIVTESLTYPPVCSMHMYGLLLDDLPSRSMLAVIRLLFVPTTGLWAHTADGTGLFSRNWLALASMSLFFWAMMFFKQAMHSLLVLVSLFGRGGNDCLRVPEREDRLLLLLLCQSMEDTQAEQRATF